MHNLKRPLQEPLEAARRATELSRSVAVHRISLRGSWEAMHPTETLPFASVVTARNRKFHL